jgi:hypothetical protein
LTDDHAIAPAREPLEALVQAAIEDLSGRLHVAARAITVISAQPVRWPDRSLGCPQQGMVYPQVMVDGAKIVLSTGGRTYAYHQGGSRGPFLCGQGLTSQ